MPAEFQKGIAVHISIDNSGETQQTLTGAHTTHYTNGTVFQVDVGDEETERGRSQDERRAFDEDITIEEVYGTFNITKKVLPPSTIYEDKKDDDLLRWCLNRDLAWVLTIAVRQQLSNVEKLEPLWSWTAFMKQVTRHETNKAFSEYLLVVPLPPGDDICKWYLGKMTEMVDDLECDFIFLHSNEAVYCKIMMIKWLNERKYDKIITLLGSFHSLLVILKILQENLASSG